jgi:hypothetical protein
MQQSFLEYLRAIEKRPGMYLGGPSISHLQTFIMGYQMGRCGTDDTTVLDGFDFWVYHRYRHGGSRSWAQELLKQAGGDEAAAFDLFVAHFDEYLEERERIGTPAIKARFMTMQKDDHVA